MDSQSLIATVTTSANVAFVMERYNARIFLKQMTIFDGVENRPRHVMLEDPVDTSLTFFNFGSRNSFLARFVKLQNRIYEAGLDQHWMELLLAATLTIQNQFDYAPKMIQLEQLQHLRSILFFLWDQFIKREREQVVNSLYAGSTNSSGSSYLKMNGPTNNGTNNVVASRTTWHHHMPPPPPPVAPGSNGQDYAQHHHHHHQQQQQMAVNNGSNTFGNNINLVDGYTSGWGQSRHEPTRPASLPMGPGSSANANVAITSPSADISGLMLGGGRHSHTGQSAESSSESEASFIKGMGGNGAGKDAKDKKAGSGVFRIFSKKKSKNHN
ncbi:hypothetical protein quinque_000717 [Culex quinquefasciatus]